MQNIKRFLFAYLLLLVVLLLKADDTFTAAETQQISIPTSGLFEKSNTITLHLEQVGNGDYAFPLPVGKAVVASNNELHISTTAGDAVKAMFAGKVRVSRNIGGFGNVVVIRHNNGLETVYSKNAQNLVKVGDEIKAGQTIAIVGGEHGKVYCRFFMMINGSRINPSIILDINSQRLFKQALICEKRGNRVHVSVKERKGEQADADAKKKIAGEADKKRVTEEKQNGNRLNLSSFSATEWAYPLPGGRMISDYGGKRRHGGVDLKLKGKDDIVAAFAGTVTRSGTFSGYGLCIVIQHANGLETLYSHQSKNLVKVGQKVKAGELIGITGRTGRATTEHLHFEVKYKGVRLNPSMVFNYATRSLQNHTLVYSNGRVKSEKNNNAGRENERKNK